MEKKVGGERGIFESKKKTRSSTSMLHSSETQKVNVCIQGTEKQRAATEEHILFHDFLQSRDDASKEGGVGGRTENAGRGRGPQGHRGRGPAWACVCLRVIMVRIFVL